MPPFGKSQKTAALTRREAVISISIATAALPIISLSSNAEEFESQQALSLPTGSPSNEHLIAGIDPKNLVDQYTSRKLDKVSDGGLYRQAVAIISRPQAKCTKSFTLHAPLELMARFGLLSYVDPTQRSLARLQMVASASAYESGVQVATAPSKVNPFPSLASAKTEFTNAFRAADADGLEALVLQIAAQFGTASLVQLLTPLALPTLTGASHSHIGLWLLIRHARAGDSGDASLLRAAVRRIAADPSAQLSSFSGMAISGSKPLDRSPTLIEQDILNKLSRPSRGERSGRGLRALFEAGEQTGNADTLFGEFIRHDLNHGQMDAAFRAVMRVCAHSMLQDRQSQSKFGWSHCLTLPQAACGLSSLNIDRKLALAATLVWITSYRSVLSKKDLDFSWTPPKPSPELTFQDALNESPEVAGAKVWHAKPEEIPNIVQTLATQASIRNDQHLVKYTRACFDMGSFDPSFRQLYLASAAHLCALWISETPQDGILDNLLMGRET